MSDTPKFTVVDRRKFRAEEETNAPEVAKADSKPELKLESKSDPTAPRLTLVEPAQQSAAQQESARPAVAIAEEPEPAVRDSEIFDESYDDSMLPPAPTAEESHFQQAAYDNAAERIETLVRAQNPGATRQEKIGFEHLLQQLYLSAMMQMGAGTPEGQRPRIDILGARQTIDLLQVLQDKTQGNLSPEQARAVSTVLFEVRLTFVDLTRMISAQPPVPPPPGADPGANR